MKRILARMQCNLPWGAVLRVALAVLVGVGGVVPDALAWWAPQDIPCVPPPPPPPPAPVAPVSAGQGWHKVVTSGGSHVRGFYYHPYGGGWNGYSGPGGGVDAPTRGLWEARLQARMRARFAAPYGVRFDGPKRLAYVYAGDPCGGYDRAPVHCRMATRAWDPVIDGD